MGEIRLWPSSPTAYNTLPFYHYLRTISKCMQSFEKGFDSLSSMADMETLNMQLLDTIQSMKLEGLVDDYFIVIYSLKEHIGDTFCLDVIANFCSDARDVLKLLTQIMSDLVLNFNLMKEYVYKVKGSALSVGARRMAIAFTNFERAIDAASKEECLKALNLAQHEYSALEEKLHIWIQLERRIILAAQQWSTNEFYFVGAQDCDGTLESIVKEGTKSQGKSII